MSAEPDQSGPLVVHGGLGSAELRYDDMRHVAGSIEAVAERLRGVAGAVAGCADDPDVLAGGLLSPATCASATVQLLDAATGPGGLVPLVVRMEGTAIWVRSTVEVLIAYDAAQAAALDALQDAAGAAVGVVVWGALGAALTWGVPVAVVGTLTAATVAAAGAVTLVTAASMAHWSQEATGLLHDVADGEVGWREVGGRLDELSARSAVAGGVTDLAALWPGTQQWLTAFGGNLADAVGEGAARTLYENPWVYDVAGGAEGMVTVLAPLGWAAGLVSGDPVDPGGIPFPPRTYGQAVALLIAMGEPHGAFQDGTVSVTALPEPITKSENATAVVPTGVEDILRGQGQVMVDTTAPDLQNDVTAGRIRVIQVAQPDGSSAWIVQIPGTQIWTPQAGPNPADLTSNVWLEAQRRTATMEAAQQALHEAMAKAGVDPADGQPVMLTGHSQGGMTAAALAADPSFSSEFNVTHVVTAGAPIARIDIPADVQVLSLEHDRDPVPRLDGEANPERENWITVTRDHRNTRGGYLPTAVHGGDAYRPTAAEADASDDPSLAAYRDSASEFWTGEGTVTDYQLRRTP